MAKFTLITKAEFSHKRWQPVRTYSFASKDSICSLVSQELPKAAMSFPIAMAYIHEKPSFVAVQGIKPGTNVFVDKNGKWIGNYIPAAYRGYPFTLANTDDSQQVLCFDEESDLLSDSGERFYDDNGKPAAAIKRIVDFLKQVQKKRTITQKICSVLHEKNLIQPWSIKVKVKDEETPVKGLFRIDEAALNALDKDSFDEIRQAGALPLIYCQLLSMQKLRALVDLAVKIEWQKPVIVPDIDQLFGEGNDLFKF